MELTLRRINLAMQARDRARCEWGKTYWQNIINKLRKELT